MAEKNKKTVSFDPPIKIGEEEYKKIEVRTPNAGELRGISITSLLNFEAGALITALSRVSNPSFSEMELDQMPANGLIALGTPMVEILLGE